MQKRRKPPDPFTSYAIMLADIIRDSPRKKMTLQELYDYLRVRYPEHFPDDGFDDKAEGKAGYGGGWRVFHSLTQFLVTDLGRTLSDMRCR
jgi:Forkhead domain